jgi:protein-S-isoprenylcysteine O-methyltransferase Ste14
MRSVELVFAVGWAAFWLYWLVAAFSVKRGRVLWGRHLVGFYFVYSATVEERCFTEQFPNAYPAYKRSTKMLVPFIL